jgi:hypothetical protein
MPAGSQIGHLNWSPDLVDAFQPSIDANPWGYGTALEVLNGCHAFEYGKASQHALIAVRPVQRQAGTRLDVIALVSTGDRLEANAFDDRMLTIASLFGANQLAMSTLRPHVAAVAKRSGWINTGVLMIKPIGQKQ